MSPQGGCIFPPPDARCLREFVTEAQVRKKNFHKAHSQVKPCAQPAVINEWLIDDDAETRQRERAHRDALKNNKGVFHKRREPGGMLDYGEQRFALRDSLGSVHLVRDMGNLAPPIAGYTHSRCGPSSALDENPPAYDVEFSAVRPRTTGYNPGHVRSLCAAPASFVSFDSGGNDSLSSAHWQFNSLISTRGSTAPPPSSLYPSSHPRGRQPIACSRQVGLRSSCASIVLDGGHARSMSPSTDHLGLSRGRMSAMREQESLRLYRFDSSQRRTSYCEQLRDEKRRRAARQEAAAACEAAAKLEIKNSREQMEAIRLFEERLKVVLSLKREVL